MAKVGVVPDRRRQGSLHVIRGGEALVYTAPLKEQRNIVDCERASIAFLRIAFRVNNNALRQALSLFVQTLSTKATRSEDAADDELTQNFKMARADQYFSRFSRPRRRELLGHETRNSRRS